MEISAQTGSVLSDNQQTSELCRENAIRQWRSSLKRKDLSDEDRVIGAIESYDRQRLALELRAVPDVPELVRYSADLLSAGWNSGAVKLNGEYVRHDKAAAVIAAKDDRLRKSEQDKVGMLAHIAELEAKLTQIEKQEVFGYVFTTPEYDAGGMTCFTKYKPASGNDNWYSNLTAVYAAPVASDADLRAANERLREAAKRYLEASKGHFHESDYVYDGELAESDAELFLLVNPSEKRT